MKKTLAFVLAAALSVGTAFTGCSSSQQDSSAPAEPVELNLYLHNGLEPGYIQLYQDVAKKKFEDSHPNTTVNITLVADGTGLAKQQLAAGAGPDIISMDGPSSLQLFAAADYILPLQNYAEKYDWENRFAGWALETCKRDGQQMGLPGAIDALVVYYNKDMFQSNGWKVPGNYEELESLCEAMKEKDVIPFAFGSSDFKQANEWWLSASYNAAMGGEGMKKVLTGETAWNSPEMKEATRLTADLWKNKYIYENSAAITMDDARNLFVTQKAGMMMSGQWDAATIISSDPAFEWDVFQMPSWKEGEGTVLPVALGGANGVNANCKNPEAAVEFLNWMYNDELVMGLLQYGAMSPLKGIDLEKAPNMDSKSKQITQMILDAQSSGKVGYCAWTYWPPNVETYAWNNIEALYYDQITLDEYTDNLQKNFDMDKEKGNLFKF